MDDFIWPSIIPYLLFSIFVFYQQRHARYFDGGSLLFGTLLVFSAFLGTITGLIYLGYYAWNISVWAAIAIGIAAAFISGIGGFMLEQFIHEYVISYTGFLAWPLLGYLMFAKL